MHQLLIFIRPSVRITILYTLLRASCRSSLSWMLIVPSDHSLSTPIPCIQHPLNWEPFTFITRQYLGCRGQRGLLGRCSGMVRSNISGSTSFPWYITLVRPFDRTSGELRRRFPSFAVLISSWLRPAPSESISASCTSIQSLVRIRLFLVLDLLSLNLLSGTNLLRPRLEDRLLLGLVAPLSGTASATISGAWTPPVRVGAL